VRSKLISKVFASLLSGTRSAKRPVIPEYLVGIWVSESGAPALSGLPGQPSAFCLHADGIATAGAAGVGVRMDVEFVPETNQLNAVTCDVSEQGGFNHRIHTDPVMSYDPYTRTLVDGVTGQRLIRVTPVIPRELRQALDLPVPVKPE
jgi:hypothetical protein